MLTNSVTEEATFRKTVLENGLRVVSSEMPHTRSVSIGIYVGVGSRYESVERAGVSHFLEHMLFKGTSRMPTAREISESIEGTGGTLNAGTEHELTTYWCRVARPHFRESLELLLELLRNSLFEPDSIEKERMVIVEELNMINDYPGAKVDAFIDEMLWPEHPLGRDIGGTKESITSMSRDDLLDHLETHYTASNIVVSVAGNVEHVEVVDLVSSLSDQWTAGIPQPWVPAGPVQSEPQVRLQTRRTEQAHLAIAVPGVSLVDPDRYALELMSIVLGEGMSSRLFVEIRENRALAYDIQSGVSHFLDSGAFVITAGVDPKRVYEAVQTVLEQTAGMRDSLSDEELEKAKRYTTGRMLLRMEDTRAVIAWMGNQELLYGGILEVDQVMYAVEEVTTHDVMRVAGNLFVSERLNMAVVGPSRSRSRLAASLTL